MSKVRRIAWMGMLSVLLLAATAMAGPGGNHNGDPDGPQVTHPLAPTSGTTGLDDVQGGAGPVSVTSQVPETWKFVLRIYLRLHGISFR